MKDRRATVVALACTILAACSAQPPAEPPLPPGKVVLARFTADVDLAAGTFTIRNEPVSATPGDRAALVTLDGEVTVANKPGSVFIGTSAFACPDFSFGNTWGATVQVTNNNPSTRLSGVYAEILTFGGSLAAQGSCSNNDVVPTGTTSANGGLWSYDLIAAGATGEVQWVFKWASATKFSFRGRIVGVKLDTVALGNGHTALNTDPGSLANDGTSLLVASTWDAGTSFGIEFVDPTTLAVSQTVTTPGKVVSIATSSSRIWYVTQPPASGLFYVGYMNLDGTGHVSTQVDVRPSLEPVTMESGPIVADPANAMKAWFAYCARCDLAPGTPIADAMGNGSAFRGFTTAGGMSGSARTVSTLYRGGTPSVFRITGDYLQWMVPVAGAPNTMWVTTDKGMAADAYVRSYSLASDPATVLVSNSASPCNTIPYVITAGPGSLLYFGDIGATGRVCSLDPSTNAVAEVGSAKGPGGTTSWKPYGLAVTGTAGSESVWEALNDGTATFTGIYGLNAVLPVRTTSGTSKGATWPIHSFAGYLWTVDNAGLYRVAY